MGIAAPAARAPDASSHATDNAAWYGEMDTADRRWRFAILPAGEDGATPTLWSFDEGGRSFPLDRYSEADGRLSFAINATGAAYAGEIDASGMASGTWSQRGASLPLRFRRPQGTPVPPPADEVWGGTLDAVVQKLPLRFRVTTRGDGKREVWMDSLAQGAGGFRGDLAIDGNAWTITVPAVKGDFSGKLQDDGKLTGLWKQGGTSLELVLEKAAANDAVPQVTVKRRPQTPKPPFPYRVREMVFLNQADGIKLAGTVTSPPGPGPHPAVALVSGSGPQDRDESLLEHKPFLVLADALTRAGIAVLRYDDRGVGGSEGSPATATSEDLSRDAEAAFDVLRQLEDIDPQRVGIVGHSEGGMIAAMLAARRPEVAAIVMMAGTGVDGGRILLSQGELVLRAEGISDDNQLRRQRITQSALIDTIRESQADADEGTLVRLATEKVRAGLGQNDAATADPALEEAVQNGVRQAGSPWFRYFIAFDPATAIEKVNCPVLALVGEKDVQVDPKLNLPAIRDALAAGGNTRSTVEELSGLNHLFQRCTRGAVSEYDSIEETIAPEALARIRDWLLERLGDKELLSPEQPGQRTTAGGK